MKWYPYGSAVPKARLGDFLGRYRRRHWMGPCMAARNGDALGSQALGFPGEAILGPASDA